MPFRVVPARDRLLNRLVKRAAVQEVGRGDAVIRAGEPATHVLLLREGLLHVEERPDRRDDGPGRVVDLVFPRELAALDALSHGTHRWSLVAEEPARIQLLDGGGVRRVVRRAEGTFDAWHRADRRRLELFRRLGPGASAPAAERLGRVLLHLAERAGGEEAIPELPVRVTHRVLGEMAGLHRSTVTTLLNDWLYRGHLEPLDPGWRLTAPRALLE